MRLHSAHIKNFKLLEEVDLSFSTCGTKPLTVIRAENGSGKTSILEALRWAMWGNEGLSRRMPLSSVAKPSGRSVDVQVRVEFSDIDDYTREETRYRLIRTCRESRGEGDAYERSPESVRLYRVTSTGAEEIEAGRDARIAAILPLSLANVFFTNGDDVQRFIASGASGRAGQEYVHQAIRHLLGLEQVEKAKDRLDSATKKFRQQLTEIGSDKLRDAVMKLEDVENEMDRKIQQQNATCDRISNVQQQIREDERELDNLKSIGDLETIQSRIHDINRDIEHLEAEEKDIRGKMKDTLQSEALSERMLWRQLQSGIAKLEDLADRNVIPGIAVGVLRDRLELGTCICGSELSGGSDGHTHILRLVEEHSENTSKIDRLTTLRHKTMDMSRTQSPSGNSGQDFINTAKALNDSFTNCKDLQRSKQSDLKFQEDLRSRIDEERVQILTSRLASNKSKEKEFNIQLGELNAQIQSLDERKKQWQELVEKAEREEGLSENRRMRYDIATDLSRLADGVLGKLKSEYVKEVSQRMNHLFLDIVGADTSTETNLFDGVDIDDNTYDIVIRHQNGRTLDADTELNGASQRVLTLSLIWALMEVAKWEAPRIIDTPLGMTSGAVKHRMVDLLTKSFAADELPYQIVLFMTRSEIRDIEPLLQDRAGLIATLTCSKDYPRDVVNDWGIDYPVVRVCACDHIQYCSLCERRNDKGRLTKRSEIR